MTDKMNKGLIAMNTAWIDYLMVERRVLTVGYIRSAYYKKVTDKSLGEWLRDEFPHEWVKFNEAQVKTKEGNYEFE